MNKRQKNEKSIRHINKNSKTLRKISKIKYTQYHTLVISSDGSCHLMPYSQINMKLRISRDWFRHPAWQIHKLNVRA